MINNSYIELNLAAINNNLNFIKSLLKKNCEFCSVVKGNAYGHGIDNFVPAIHSLGVKSFAVSNAGEAKAIVDLNLDLDRIMIMGFIDQDQIDWAIHHGVEFYIFDLNRLQNAISIAKALKAVAKVHIELETGFNRTGFTENEFEKLFKLLQRNAKFIEVKGVCSHLAGAENIANYFRIKNQIKRFNTNVRSLKNQDFSFQKTHLACSAAMMNYKATRKDMVRVGIMQYGLWPSKEVKIAHTLTQNQIEEVLMPVLSWKTKVMSIKHVSKGEYIGYGSSYMAEMDMIIAAIPVGYADGFARSLSNQGKVIIGGKRLDVIGTVNMNLFLVDITNAPQVAIGDEVVLIGSQADQTISVASFSDFSSQLNYELLTRLPADIPRIITN